MSKSVEITVPDIGDFEDVPVIEILVAEGDTVEAEQSLITLESDKATMEVPAPVAGVIQSVNVSLNDTVNEGDLILTIAAGETEGAASSRDSKEDLPAEDAEDAEKAKASASAKDAKGAKDAKTKDSAEDAEDAKDTEIEDSSGDEGDAKVAVGAASRRDSEPQAPSSSPRQTPPAQDSPARDVGGVPYASPAIRRFARELGVDLSKVEGSGKRGRILREDVAGFVKKALSRPAPSGGLGFDFPPAPKVDFSKYGKTEAVELSKIRKISGKHLHRNWVGIPHVTHNDEADITDMEAFRKASSEEALAQGFKLTPLVFLIKASVAALRKFPDFNASLDESGERLIRKKYFNIGIAVDTPEGLVVPVLRECETKGIMELARELSEVSAKAREGKLSPSDMSGGCFSISSLGGIGGTGFSPIINAPEVAILGVSRSRTQPVWDGEAFKPRLMLPLSLSYDHRVIDGASAARFARYLASRLEDLRRLTL